MDKRQRDLESIKRDLANELDALRDLAPDAKSRNELIRIRDSLHSSGSSGQGPHSSIDFEKLAADIGAERDEGRRKVEEIKRNLEKANIVFGEVSGFGVKVRSPIVPTWLAILVICFFLAVLVYAAFRS